MAFDVSALPAYVDQTRKELILKMQFEAKTAKIVTVFPGVKATTALNKMSTDAIFQANGCGFNASGTTTFSQRNITVGDVKINEKLCPKDLKAKYLQHMLKPGAYDEKTAVPFEQQFVDEKIKTMASQIETALWQGDTNSASAALNKWDGFLKIITAEYLKDQSTSAGIKVLNAVKGLGTIALTSGDATVTGTGTSFTTQVEAGDKIRVSSTTYTVLSVTNDTELELTASAGANVPTTTYKIIPAESNVAFTSPYTAIDSTNVTAILNALYQALPITLLNSGSPVILMGWDVFRAFQIALTTANQFHYTAETANGELILPGTNIKMIALNGLNGTGTLVGADLSNLYYGVDLLDDAEKFRLWYSEDNDEFRFAAEFKAGTQIGVPEEILLFQTA